MRAAPHRLLDILDRHRLTPQQLRRDAFAEIAEITAAGRIPLFVGGTMLYFKALLEGYRLCHRPIRKSERRLSSRQQSRWEACTSNWRRIDPVAAARIHPNNPQRLSRALEFILSFG
ncbi:hypothetical protein ACNKHS_25605 [Shigella flexneri]